MELNRDQIIKALECCGKGDLRCSTTLARDALALIKELTVELEAMRGAANSYKMHYGNAKADTAREIFEEIEPVFMSFCLSLDAYTAWKYLKERYLSKCE